MRSLGLVAFFAACSLPILAGQAPPAEGPSDVPRAPALRAALALAQDANWLQQLGRR